MSPLQVLQGHSEASLEPSFLQAEQPQLPQSSKETCSSLCHLCVPPGDSLQQVPPVLGTGPKVGSQAGSRGAESTPQRGRITTLHLLPMLLWMQLMTGEKYECELFWGFLISMSTVVCIQIWGPQHWKHYQGPWTSNPSINFSQKL